MFFMNKIYAYAMAASMALTSFGAFAADEGVTIIADPAQGSVLTEIPETITFTFEGPASIAKPTLGGNPVTITDPAGTTRQCVTVNNWAIVDGKSFSVKVHSDLDRTMAGEWTVKLRKDGVMFVDADGVKTGCSEDVFNYTVGEEETGLKVVFDPALDGTYEEFPETFTVSFPGTESIKNNIAVSKVCIVYEPGATEGILATPTWDKPNSKVTFKTQATLNRNLSGEYRVHFNANSIQLVYPEETVKIEAMDFYYNIDGNGGGEDPGNDEVKYDITMTGTTPNLAKGLDISERTLETLQMTFSASCLQPLPDAMVTISGPNYKHTANIKYNMGTAANPVTWMKANFPVDPAYNGTYTLTIPEGVLGDEAWLADPEKGHANAAVEMTFEVTGGQEWTGDEKQTTLNPIEVLPVSGNKVETLNFVILGFEEDVFYDEGLTFKVGIKEDASALSFTNFGTATVSGSGNSVRLDISPKPTVQAEYQIVIPEGSFRNAENADEATNVNSDLTYFYNLRPVTEKLTVLSTDPKADAYVQGFHIGEGITVNTNNNDKVARMDLTITAYALDNDAAAPKTILTATTTTKNEEGAICWLAEEDLEFNASNFYEVAYTLYDEEGTSLYDNLYEFYGANGFVLVEAIFGNNAPKAVYNMQGMRINSDINTLPAGLYIIDGKKIMIRK